MKAKGLSLIMLLFAMLMIVFTGCKDDPPPVTVDYFDVMTTYMADNGMDLSDITSEWIISADAVNTAGIENFYIIDMRSADDFNTIGHIEGAHNTTLGNVLTEAANADKPILLVCYTGQTASHAHVALRLSGYTDCKVLMFGMSSWNSACDSWTANTANIGTGNANWSATNTIETTLTFSEPDFTATASTGADILEERVTYMLGQGFKGVTSADVLATPTNYYINNYWAEADVNTYGHIVGAYRIKEDLTLAADGFKHLDPDATVVTYCWTGQTSSLVTAYLTVLGYDAKSLKFGTNGMIYDALQAHKWVASGDYPIVQD
jgi:rhodanese-related sulfurtransferase